MKRGTVGGRKRAAEEAELTDEQADTLLTAMIRDLPPGPFGDESARALREHTANERQAALAELQAAYDEETTASARATHARLQRSKPPAEPISPDIETRGKE